MKIKITPAVDSSQTVCGPINMIGKTLFKQVKLHLNGKLAFDSGEMYAYRAMMETELNYGREAKESFLQSGLYIKDEPANKINTKDNLGLVQRAKFFADGNTVELMAPIHCDLFMTDRLMLSNTEMQLELHRNSNAFAILADGLGGNIKIEEMIWYVKKVVVAPSVHLAIEHTLQKTPAKYPMRRIQMTKLSLPSGRLNAPTTAVFNGQIPRRMVIGLVETSAYFGNPKKSPFVFAHHNLAEIAVHAGGNQYPRDPLRMDYSKGQFMRPFTQLVEGMGIDSSNDVSLADFKLCTCLYVFDLTPEETDNNNWQLLRQGTTTIHALFNKEIPSGGLEMIIYGEFDNLAMIDRTRNIYFDYTI